MPDSEFCRNMDQEMMANRVRSLKSDELSSLVEYSKKDDGDWGKDEGSFVGTTAKDSNTEDLESDTGYQISGHNEDF